MIERDWADAFAKEWIDAWNAHDLERIFSHYREDFEMISPLIMTRLNVRNGRLKGKDVIRQYWSQGLGMTPNLRFELRNILIGVNSVAIMYRNVTAKRTVVEYLEFDENRQVVRAEALHGPSE